MHLEILNRGEMSDYILFGRIIVKLHSEIPLSNVKKNIFFEKNFQSCVLILYRNCNWWCDIRILSSLGLNSKSLMNLLYCNHSRCLFFSIITYNFCVA